jgi:hypothetical protein
VEVVAALLMLPAVVPQGQTEAQVRCQNRSVHLLSSQIISRGVVCHYQSTHTNFVINLFIITAVLDHLLDAGLIEDRRWRSHYPPVRRLSWCA